MDIYGMEIKPSRIREIYELDESELKLLLEHLIRMETGVEIELDLNNIWIEDKEYGHFFTNIRIKSQLSPDEEQAVYHKFKSKDFHNDLLNRTFGEHSFHTLVKNGSCKYEISVLVKL